MGGGLAEAREPMTLLCIVELIKRDSIRCQRSVLRRYQSTRGPMFVAKWICLHLNEQFLFFIFIVSPIFSRLNSTWCAVHHNDISNVISTIKKSQNSYNGRINDIERRRQLTFKFKIRFFIHHETRTRLSRAKFKYIKKRRRRKRTRKGLETEFFFFYSSQNGLHLSRCTTCDYLCEKSAKYFWFVSLKGISAMRTELRSTQQRKQLGRKQIVGETFGIHMPGTRRKNATARAFAFKLSHLRLKSLGLKTKSPFFVVVVVVLFDPQFFVLFFVWSSSAIWTNESHCVWII